MVNTETKSNIVYSKEETMTQTVDTTWLKQLIRITTYNALDVEVAPPSRIGIEELLENLVRAPRTEGKTKT